MGGKNKAIFIALMPGFFVLTAFSLSGLLNPGPALMIGLGFLVGGLWLGQEINRMRKIGTAPKEKGAARIDSHLLESIPLPVVVVDGRRKVKIANSQARQAFGGGMEARDLGVSIRQPEILTAVTETLSTGVAANIEASLPGKVERTYLVNTVPIGNEHGRIGSVLLTLHDITTVKVAENFRADFVANVSHELRTPLAAIVGFIETLQGEAAADVEAQERFLNIMSVEAGRMSRLIEDLLSLSKIEGSEHVAPDDLVDIEGVIEGVVNALDRQAADKGMTLITNLPANLPAIIGEPSEVTQVFTNLVANAISYGREGTAVTIRAESDVALVKSPGKGVRISVEDHGEGIAPEHIVRLTERFYRVDKARSRNLGGTGLGLAIVKHIVNRHRGILNIESVEGQGSTFSVLLPSQT